MFTIQTLKGKENVSIVVLFVEKKKKKNKKKKQANKQRKYETENVCLAFSKIWHKSLYGTMRK